MSSIGNLPPPFPNAAQSLSKVAGDAQLRARIEQSAENAPIKTSFPTEPAQAPSSDTGSAGTQSQGNGNPAQNGLDVTV